LARAEAQLESAQAFHAEASRRHYLAELKVETAEADLAAARTAARLDEIAEEEGELRGRLPALDGALASARAEEEAAQEAWGAARAVAENHQSLVQAALAKAQLASARAQQEREREAAARRARDELRVGYWQNGWGRGAEAARQALDAAPELMRRLTPKTLRNRAAEALRDALRAYGVTNADAATSSQTAMAASRATRSISWRLPDRCGTGSTASPSPTRSPAAASGASVKPARQPSRRYEPRWPSGPPPSNGSRT
jgi:hypothetical protein